MKLNLPSDTAREVMRTFLNECVDDTFVEALVFTKPPSGMMLTVHYRDAKGHSHKKNLLAPDAKSPGDIEDMVVLASEWLAHGASKALDRAKVTVQ